MCVFIYSDTNWWAHLQLIQEREQALVLPQCVDVCKKWASICIGCNLVLISLRNIYTIYINKSWRIYNYTIAEIK